MLVVFWLRALLPTSLFDEAGIIMGTKCVFVVVQQLEFDVIISLYNLWFSDLMDHFRGRPKTT